MSNSDSLLSTQPAAPVSLRWGIALVLAVWFVLIVALAAAGVFITPLGAPPLPVALAATVPLALFFAGLGLSRPFRDFVAAIDLSLILGVQAWRFGGFAFVVLYVYDLLPGGFALPAGLGDMAIAATAPLILLAVVREPRFVAGKTFAAWNALGILDLVVAVGSGALSATFATGAVGEISMLPMGRFPLVVIPAYFVPILIMLHVAALMPARRAAAALGAS